MHKIEFYKNRSLGDRFSASAQFIRENWLILLKHIVLPALPIVLVQAYFSMRYLGGLSGMLNNLEIFTYSSSSILFMFLYLLFTLLLSLYIPSMSGALMSKYEKGLLTKETKFKDLSRKMFSNMGKFVLIMLSISVITFVVAFLFPFL